MTGRKLLTTKYYFPAFSFHPVDTRRRQTWPTLVKCALPCGLLDWALCLTLTSVKTSAGMQVGTWDGLSVHGAEVKQKLQHPSYADRDTVISFDAL